jgi:hypothetical protein
MIRFLLVFALFWAHVAFATANTANVISLNTATTNVTTSSYVTLVSSLPIVPSQIVIVNATSSVIKLAYGASGSETDFVSVSGSSTIIIDQLSRHLTMGVRLAVEAISASASSGYVSVSLIP